MTAQNVLKIFNWFLFYVFITGCHKNAQAAVNIKMCEFKFQNLQIASQIIKEIKVSK